jgi:RimJ/RimL family protein N-acetyltransferase
MTLTGLGISIATTTTALSTNRDAVSAARRAADMVAVQADPDREVVVLTDGTKVPMRPIRPADAAALRRFHRGLSDRTIYQRFFASLPELSESQARYFAEVDGQQRYALVALDPDRPGELVAVVRFDREPGTDRAEYAAVVADPWQGRGLGLALTRRLIEAARRRGVRRLFAFVLPGNARMLGLLRDLGLPERISFTNGADRVEIDLVERTPCTKDSADGQAGASTIRTAEPRTRPARRSASASFAAVSG